MYGVWVGLSKLNTSLGYLKCLFPKRWDFPGDFLAASLIVLCLGYVDGPCPLLNLLNVGDLLLNKYLRNSFACGGNVAMRYDNIYLLSPLLPGRYSF